MAAVLDSNGPSRHALEIRKGLDHVKTRFYEIEELTAEWDSEQRDKIVTMWMSMMKKLVGLVRKASCCSSLERVRG